jgi:hypothetical protein
MALWDNLQGFWKLNDLNYLDETANDNDLSLNGTAPDRATGMASGTNAALLLEDGYLEISDANQTGLDITGNLTVFF